MEANLLGRRRALGGKASGHLRTSCVSSNHPGMQKRVPVNRVFFPQATEQRIWISEDGGVKQLVQAQSGCGFVRWREGVDVATHS